MSRESEILAYQKQYKNLFNKYLRRYSGYGFDLDDIRSEMNVALINAYDHYDPTRGVEFGLCLSFWVKERLMKFSVKNKKIISAGAYSALKKDKSDSVIAWENFKITTEDEAFTIADSNVDIERSLYEKECITNIKKLLSSDKSKVLIGRLNGLTLEQLGNILGKSKERIRQICNEGLKEFTNKQNYNKL